jgi:metallo-beta-lactamase class B
MKCSLTALFSAGMLLAGCSSPESTESPDVGSTATFEAHVTVARDAASRPGHDFTPVFDTLCAEPDPAEAEPTTPQPTTMPTPDPRSEWFVEPAKVFDNLYYVGSMADSNWAVSTSEGIILIDTGYHYTVEELVDGGLRKLGLDPAQIKYVIVSHAHSDHYFGARYLQDKYRPRIILSEADWNVIENDDYPADIKPRRDLVATDGMQVTLGDTTLTLHITPGHTPGTISTLIPLRDGDQRHVGSIWGGMTFGFQRAGVQYFPTLADALKTNSAQAKRYKEIAAKAGADVFLSIHTRHDRTLDKINALKSRRPGDAHPFVSSDAIQRHLTVISECSDAQVTRL